MRVCRSVVLLFAIVAVAGCARQPRPYAQHTGMQAYAASPPSGTSLDEMTYGGPARPQYGPPPGYRPAPRPSYARPSAYRPPPGYRPVPVPAYASPPPAYRPAPPGYRPAPRYYGPPPVAYRRVPPPSYPMQRPARYVPMMKLPEDGPYTLDTGDKLRIVVFGQDTLSNTYLVDAAGQITMPLIGAVNARDATTQGLAAAVRNKLASGFIREPSVAVEVEVYRPFFVLGEVTYPGQYPFVPHMTVENAVAIAGGFTPRATKSSVTITRRIQGMPRRFPMPLGYTMRPGDVVTVGERWF